MESHWVNLFRLSPAVGFVALWFKELGYDDDQDLILDAAKAFCRLSSQEVRDAEACGRAVGCALGVLKREDLPPLDEDWIPEWMITKRDESNDELDWSELIGPASKG